MIDIIFPQNNEKEFIAIAEKLDFSGLIFIYPYQKNINPQEKITELQKSTKLKLSFGLIAEQEDILKAKNKSDFVITNSANQKTFEKLKPNLIYNLESNPKKDSLHYRLSGLNQVLCNLANQNNIIIGFSINSILNSKDKQQYLGRIMQNIQFCKKYKIKTKLASFATNPYEMKAAKDLSSLGIVLGL